MVRPERHRRRRLLFYPRPFILSIVIFTLLALTTWTIRWFSQSQLAASNIAFQKRATYSEHSLLALLEDSEQGLECRLVRHADDQCAFVKSNCPDEDGLFPYIQLYYCSLRHVQPIAFTILIVWLSLLFSTIGIAASDFLCINLSTIASILGMSESLAGVTFLAFGNGSPDVFSTFAAMGSNSGSLAVGELIGAACFITAVVAGSMALVRPFRVARRSFVRDIGYFIIAGSFSLVVLADGELHVWECATMIGLYIFYVVMVVSWHWYLTRKRRKYEREYAARTHFHIPQSQELDLEEPVSDDDPVAGETTSLLHGHESLDLNVLESDQWPAWEDDDEDDETRNRYLAEIRENMHVSRPTPPQRRTTVNPIRPSLVGALEFQSVLSSLKKAKSIHEDNIDLHQYSNENGSNTREQGTSNRNRSVSMNDVPGIQIDTTNIPKAGMYSQPEVSTNHMSQHPETLPEPLSLRSPLLTLPPTSSNSSIRSEIQLQPPQPNNHLTVPGDTFRVPNYQASPNSPHLSPGDVSPMSNGGVPRIPSYSETDDETSATVPFPAFLDTLTRSPPSLRPFDLFGSAASLRNSAIAAENGLAQEIIPEPVELKWWPHRCLPPFRLFFVTFFPTLCNWRTKSVWEKLLGAVAAPSVFCLTMTVPVIEPYREDADQEAELPLTNDGTEQIRPIVRLPEDSPLLRPRNESSVIDQGTLDHDSQSVHRIESINRGRLDSEMPALETQTKDVSSPTRIWYRWLTIVQTFTAPLFVVVIVWFNIDVDHDPRKLIIPILCSLLVSLLCAALLITVLKDRTLSHPPDWLRPILAFIGFIVGICWIATIADEVVSLLKTIGVIMNISDSLLGLTVFAVGNSLGDLVADVTVARLGFPVMALSACFGGPMLNILLGIGIGGLYMTWQSTQQQIPAAGIHREPYRIMISKTLIISGLTLLITLLGLLIIVPLNSWKMDRRIGWGLVVLWTLSTLGNVIAEILF
ncbi:Sodium/calcium exchanger protein-domain-containing protein [Talaromyces proteolyticus]|uniref:Sodium/calcium exchanger protein-domain-containing protein n=1 Tax=Talaromyces proteolyticus TaxID=1131652 RepID=A0AAD4KXD8_9EURO|nr:Sodium/calcium exchanger protein-domain-containing protein [Talaromyces proteolyticus]KAH8698271.1 Sodium/calcium exchanger protein-domain-containing protein [Talaromyces proteolyticus]